MEKGLRLRKIIGSSGNQLDINSNDNLKTSIEEIASKISSNSNSQLNVTQFDSSGNEIVSHISSEGDYNLGTSIEQNVIADTGNSSTSNLAAGATFTGTGKTTLGIVGLQWSLKTDQNCTVYIEESPDNSNWDISYDFNYIASKGGRGETVQASQAYWRIRVINNGESTTSYFRLQGVLCPIATPLPSELSSDGRCKTESTIVGQQNTGRHLWVSPTDEIGTYNSTRLVGTNFDGTTKDPNFWSETVTGSGVIAQSGEIQLNTGITANSTTLYESTQRARFEVSSANKLFAGVKWETAATTDNIRRVGAYDDNNGFYFQLDGSTFGIGSRRSTVDTIVTSGNFNGNLGTNFTIDETLYYKVDIEWSPIETYYYINGVLLHTLSNGHHSDMLTLPIRLENFNDNGSIVDVSFDCLGITIIRQGNLTTNAQYYHISGNAATHILKYGAGTLQKIIFNNTSGTSITIYDNTAGSEAVIGTITTTSNAIGTWEYDIPFSNGLTLVTVGNNLDATIIYE